MHDSPSELEQFLNSHFESNEMEYLKDDILTSLFYKAQWTGLLKELDRTGIEEAGIDEDNSLHLLFRKIQDSRESYQKYFFRSNDYFGWLEHANGNFEVPTYISPDDFEDSKLEIMAANIAIILFRNANELRLQGYTSTKDWSHTAPYHHMDKLIFNAIGVVYSTRNAKGDDFFKHLRSYCNALPSKGIDEKKFIENWISEHQKFIKVNIEDKLRFNFKDAFSTFYLSYPGVAYTFPFHSYIKGGKQKQKVFSELVEIIYKKLLDDFSKFPQESIDLRHLIEVEKERILLTEFQSSLQRLQSSLRFQIDENLSYSNIQLFQSAEKKAYSNYYYWINDVPITSEICIRTGLTREDIANFSHLMVGVGFFESKYQAFNFFASNFLVKDARKKSTNYISFIANHLNSIKVNPEFEKFLKKIKSGNK